jgi:hypothetical protein
MNRQTGVAKDPMPASYAPFKKKKECVPPIHTHLYANGLTTIGSGWRQP